MSKLPEEIRVSGKGLLAYFAWMDKTLIDLETRNAELQELLLQCEEWMGTGYETGKDAEELSALHKRISGLIQ